MKKIKILLLVVIIGGTAWILSGGISASREKILPKALFNAISNTSSTNSNSNNNSNSNSNSQANSNQNTNTNSNTNLNVNSNINSNVNSNSTDSAQTQPQENITEKVALKVDDIIARYKIYSTPYASLDKDTQTQIEKELNDFTGTILKSSGLDFAFNIPDESLRMNENEAKDKSQYVSRVKDVLRKHNLLQDDQTIEDGMRAILLDLSNMSKNDMDWGKVNNWKKEMGNTYEDLQGMPVNPAFKNPHVRLLRIIKSLDIVVDNINESDYFRSFLAAGRAEKINTELDKFSEEIK